MINWARIDFLFKTKKNTVRSFKNRAGAAETDEAADDRKTEKDGTENPFQKDPVPDPAGVFPFRAPR